MDAQKTVWVTGASSGLGLHTAMALRADGWRVIAGARSFGQDNGEQDGILRLPLDVTDEESVRAFCRKAAETALPDALVQCAGMLVLGSCEETLTDEYRREADRAVREKLLRFKRWRNAAVRFRRHGVRYNHGLLFVEAGCVFLGGPAL